MHGFKYEFSKNFWGGAHRAPSPAQSRALPSILGHVAPSVRTAPLITHPNMFINPSPNRGVLDQTLFSPNLLHGYTTAPNISFQDYVVGLNYAKH